MNEQQLAAKIVELEARIDNVENDNIRLLRANDALEIQNIMSLHEYYHASFRHEEELDAIWAQEAEDVSFEEALFQARFVGLDMIRAYYVEFMKNTLFRSATDVIKMLYPQLADTETELPPGLSFLHTLTTPVIEIAEDGKTAKGAWISPGFTTMPTLEKLEAYWHWDKYGVDFIKEGGRWKIWHFFVGREFTSPYDKSWVDTALDGDEAYALALALFKEWDGFKEAPLATINSFNTYSPFKVATIEPQLPQPYHTFSETFSY